MDLLDVIIGIASEIFELPKEQISAQTQRKDIPGWDSVGQLALMSTIEEKLNVAIPQNMWKTLDSIGKIADYVATLL